MRGVIKTLFNGDKDHGNILGLLNMSVIKAHF